MNPIAPSPARRPDYRPARPARWRRRPGLLVLPGCAILMALVLQAPAAALPAARAARDEGETYTALIESQAPAIVTVRMVIKTEMNLGGQGHNRESRQEIAGVMVGEDGLVMLSYGPFRSDEDDGSQFQLKRIPQEIKVIFEREEKEYAAELVATDQKVNLAFLKVLDLEGRKPAWVRFDAPVEVAIGDPVMAVARLQKGFDYAPFVRSARVCGQIKKPRKALMLDGTVRTEGLPVFTPAGGVVGVLTSIESGMRDEDDGFGGFGMIMIGGGAGGSQFVLQGKVVEALVEQARKQAVRVLEEKAARPAGDSAEGASDGEEEG